MRQLRAELSSVIAADAGTVYGIIADYEIGHPRIIPRDFFSDLAVISGGRGAGTVVTVRAAMFGRVRLLRMIVAEPEPGRVLTETDTTTGMCTSFTVAPLGAGECRVTIATSWTAQPGLAGVFEGWLVPGTLRKIYGQELALLARVASEVS
jgi:hypothetical protein